MNAKSKSKTQYGLSLIELIIAMAVLSTLSALAIPAARIRIRRQREYYLSLALHDIRHSIDRYKDMADANLLGPQKLGAENYPESLEALVNGVPLAGKDIKFRFLRHIPRDPMTNSTDWGLHSNQDDPDSASWGGQNVFDVYTKSRAVDSTGEPYSRW